MAVTLTVAQLSEAVRVGDSPEETAHMARLLDLFHGSRLAPPDHHLRHDAGGCCQRSSHQVGRVLVRQAARERGGRGRRAPQQRRGRDLVAIQGPPGRESRALMPLDRRCTVRLEDRGGWRAGEFVSGSVTEIPVWCEYSDLGSTDTIGLDGVRTNRLASFTVRYREDIRAASIALTTIDYVGERWNVETIAESSRRRRFITLTCIQATGLA